MSQPRKTILFIIDSFNSSALKRAMEKKMVPAMIFLKSRGYFSDSCVSVFPTMTPTCASSIITGAPLRDHMVPGFEWFSRPEKRIINYGMSPLAVWKMGVRRVVQDLLFNLNHVQLSRKVKTLYESLEEAGFTTGAVNPYIFRGGRPYSPRIPLIMQLAAKFGLKDRLWGPCSLFLGCFCPPELGQWLRMLASPGYLRRFGLNDRYSGTVGRWIIKKEQQPDLLTIYLPDTDEYSHRHDPNQSEDSLKRADRQISKILGAFPSWDEALDRNTIIVVGDHSQSLIGKEGRMIYLKRELNKFTQLDLPEENPDTREIAVCINERMSYIYILRDRERILPEAVERLKEIKGVDQVAWRQDGWFNIVREGVGLSFRPGRELWDPYGQGWALQGDPSAAGASIRGHSLCYGDYPDALAQLYSALSCENTGDIIVTARKGFEFTGELGPAHPGCGSHGSLNREDALVPLFVAGGSFGASSPRILDLAPFIRSQFGLN